MAACDSCVYYVYDEDWEEYCCTANVDEDDLAGDDGGDDF